jgi:hypothetical protein
VSGLTVINEGQKFQTPSPGHPRVLRPSIFAGATLTRRLPPARGRLSLTDLAKALR